MSKSTFSEIVKADTPTLIDFYADWCGPCKMMKPILEELKSTLGEAVRIVKIDVDKNPQLSALFQIEGIPTLMLFKAGEVKWRKSGVVLVDELKRVVQQHTV